MQHTDHPAAAALLPACGTLCRLGDLGPELGQYPLQLAGDVHLGDAETVAALASRAGSSRCDSGASSRPTAELVSQERNRWRATR